MKPAGSTVALIHPGNATAPIVGGWAGIDHRIGSGTPAIRPPSFTPNPMPILEKITPRNVNATQGIVTAQARIRANVVRASRRVTNLTTGVISGFTTRQRGTSAIFTKTVRSVRATVQG